MTRLKELGRHEVYSTEDYRKYVRKLDKHLVDLITEVECRRSEVQGLMVGMVRFCKRKNLTHGDGPGWWRAQVATKGLGIAALNLRAARWACKKLFKDFEAKFGAELESIREYNRDRAAARRKAAARTKSADRGGR